MLQVARDVLLGVQRDVRPRVAGARGPVPADAAGDPHLAPRAQLVLRAPAAPPARAGGLRAAGLRALLLEVQPVAGGE